MEFITGAPRVLLMLMAVIFVTPSEASLLGDEVGYSVLLATGIGVSGRTFVQDSSEVRFTANGGIFGDNQSFEIDISADVIEIRRLSEPYPLPITFTFSDLDWVSYPNAKLTNVVLESVIFEGNTSPKVTFTGDSVEFSTFFTNWGNTDVLRFRLITSKKLEVTAIPMHPVPLLFVSLASMAFIDWRRRAP